MEVEAEKRKATTTSIDAGESEYAFSRPLSSYRLLNAMENNHRRALGHVVGVGLALHCLFHREESTAAVQYIFV